MISTVVLIGLATGIVAMGIAYFFLIRANAKLAANVQVIPFNSNIDPTTGTFKGFLNPQTGAPQIGCPAGTTVQIIGAFTSVIDPYAECTTSPSPQISWMCNPSETSPPATSSGGGCTTDADCPFYQGSNAVNPYGCVPPSGSTTGPGVCQLTSQLPGVTCPAGFSVQSVAGLQYCIPTDFCGSGIPNGVCSPSNTASACAVRDASDSISAVCNGMQSCNPTISDFGTPACPGLVPPQGGCISSYDSFGNPVWSTDRTGYCGLPYLPGWQGGVPSGSSTSVPNPANSSLGFQYHGVYTCV